MLLKDVQNEAAKVLVAGLLDGANQSASPCFDLVALLSAMHIHEHGIHN